MFKILYSHIYKMKKTFLLWFILLWPILTISLFINYYYQVDWPTEQKLNGYFQAISLILPCLITLLCAYTAKQEQQAGNCFNILCVGNSRFKIFFSLFTILSILISIGILLSALGFYYFWGNMSLTAYMLTSVMILLPLPSLILIQLYIALKFGYSWSIASCTCFILIGALGSTGLLDYFWYYLPPVWASRFASLTISNFFHPDNIVTVAAELRYGLLYCLVVSIILAILIPTWFDKWDGNQNIGDE